MKLRSFAVSSLVGLLIAAPALTEPRFAQSEPAVSTGEAAASPGDSTWFEDESEATPSPFDERERAEQPGGDEAPAARAVERSSASTAPEKTIVVDRGTTETSRRSDPSWRHHDGFYLRMSLGVGGLGARTTHQAGGVGFEGGSGSTAFDFMLGGTLTPGLVLGGGLHIDVGRDERGNADDMDRRSDGARSALVLGGPFIDVFPNPRGGFHFGGMLGGAAYAHSESSEADPTTFRGVGGSLWLGYQWWVARQWSLGAMLRGTSARLQSTDPLEPQEAQAGSIALLFSLLYH